MRTKTLLLAAALGAVGVATSMAQTVYSVNIVGYMNKSLPAGFSLIANQLNATPDNTPETLFGTPPHALSVIQFDRTTSAFVSREFDPDLGWGGANITMNPGQAAYVSVPPGSPPLPVTFVGEVQLNSNLEIRPGLDMYSSVLPIAGNLESLGFPTATPGAVPPGTIITVSQFVGGTFVNTSYDEEVGGWPTPGGPTVALNEGMFINNFHFSTPASFFWPRNFPVGPP